MLIQIINGRIFTPQGWLGEGSVLIHDGKILEVTNCDPALIGVRLVDAKDMCMIPGFVCMYTRGSGGHDFNECTEEAFRSIIQVHLKHDTTSSYPTISSSPFGKLHQATHVCERLMEEPDSPILELYIESPYLSRKVADEQFVGQVKEIDEQEYRKPVENTRCTHHWDTFPGLLGALGLAGYLRRKGILAAISHTKAECDDTCIACKAGFAHTIHFCNAILGFHKHREYKYGGTVESVYLTDDIAIGLIADGIHLPSIILKPAYKLEGVGHICLVTDALSCVAAEDKETSNPRYIIGDGVYKLADCSSLAGSIATIDVLVRTMTQTGILLGDTLRMALETPARVMGMYDHKDSLQEDKDTDILIIDKELNIHAVWQAGKLVQESFLNYK